MVTAKKFVTLVVMTGKRNAVKKMQCGNILLPSLGVFALTAVGRRTPERIYPIVQWRSRCSLGYRSFSASCLNSSGTVSMRPNAIPP
jgi:hypothetical protein